MGQVGEEGSKNVKLQTGAITEFMYTTYSFCYNLHFHGIGYLVNTLKYKSYKFNLELSSK